MGSSDRPHGRLVLANHASIDVGYTLDEVLELRREDVVDTSDPRLAVALDERGPVGGWMQVEASVGFQVWASKNLDRVRLRCSVAHRSQEESKIGFAEFRRRFRAERISTSAEDKGS